MWAVIKCLSLPIGTQYFICGHATTKFMGVGDSLFHFKVCYIIIVYFGIFGHVCNVVNYNHLKVQLG